MLSIKKKPPIPIGGFKRKKDQQLTVQSLLFIGFGKFEVLVDVDDFAVQERSRDADDGKKPRFGFGTSNAEDEDEDESNSLNTEEEVLNSFHISNGFSHLDSELLQEPAQ